MSDPEITETERFRRFTRWLWISGIIVVAVIGIVRMPSLVFDADTGRVRVTDNWRNENDRFERPWYEESPTPLEVRDGISVGGAEGGYITLEPGAKPLRLLAGAVENVTPQYGGSWITVSQGAHDFFSFESNTDAAVDIRQLGTLMEADHEAIYVIPGDEPMQVWFSGQLGDWQVLAEEVTPRELVDSISGQGNDLVIYRGEALSAKFEHQGTGIFSAKLFVPGQSFHDPIVGVDDFIQRISWDAAPGVLMVIESDTGDGEWTITVTE